MWIQHETTSVHDFGCVFRCLTEVVCNAKLPYEGDFVILYIQFFEEKKDYWPGADISLSVESLARPPQNCPQIL